MKIEKCSVLILVFLMLFIAVAPVFAESPKKIPVKAIVTSTVIQSSVVETNPGEIKHVEMIWTGTISFYMPETSASPLLGTYEDHITGMRVASVPGGVDHTRVNEGVFHFHEVWTFSPGNTFEGVATIKTHSVVFNIFESHIVLQGSGIYEGWTISLSLNRAAPEDPMVYYGELLIP